MKKSRAIVHFFFQNKNRGEYFQPIRNWASFCYYRNGQLGLLPTTFFLIKDFLPKS